jgi:hypothetical protein
MEDSRMKAHPLAEYFPVIQGEEFDKLVEDIKKNGQIEPIKTYKGEILDGINRYRACKVAGVEPMFEEWVGDDPLTYVVSVNIRRRHMDKGQRALLATEMLPEFEARAKGRQGRRSDIATSTPKDEDVNLVFDKQGIAKASAQAANEFGVSPKSVERAKRIVEQAPERKADILAGKASLRSVDAEIAKEKARQRVIEKQKEEIHKIVKETPRQVKEFMEALKAYTRALEIAIEAKDIGLFSPEAERNIYGRFDRIRELENRFRGE